MQVENALCADCGGCVGSCHVDCITILDRTLTIGAQCDECNVCVLICPTGALTAEAPLRDWRDASRRPKALP